MKRSPFDFGAVFKKITKPVQHVAKTVVKTVKKPVQHVAKTVVKTVKKPVQHVAKTVVKTVKKPVQHIWGLVRTSLCPGQWLTATVVNEITEIVDTLNGVKNKLRGYRYLISNKQEDIKKVKDIIQNNLLTITHRKAKKLQSLRKRSTALK